MSAATLAALLDAAPDHIFQFDLEGRLRYVNKAARAGLCAASEVARRDPPGILGRTLADLKVDERLCERLIAAVVQVATGRTVSEEAVFPTPDGPRTFECLLSPIHGAGGAVEGVAGIARDIEVRTASRRALAESIPQQVWTAQPDGNLDFVNGRVLAYFNRTEAEILGAGWLDVIHAEDRALCIERWAHSLQTGAEYEVEFRLKRWDGVYRWHLARAMPLRSPDGTIARWFGTNTDIDEKRRAIEELNQRAEFEQQLIGIVSHDLRNPISAIMTSAGLLLRNETADERTTRSARRIHSSAERAARMIHDLLDLSQVRRGGHLPIEAADCDLSEVGREAIDELRSAHPEQKIALQTSGQTTGVWDADRLAQLVGNLLGNAIQYGTPGASIQVAVRGLPEGVELAVANEGKPIAADVKATLFEPFQRGLDAVSSERSVGLGLFIVKQIALSHGGAVAVESDLQGTVFTVRLPRVSGGRDAPLP